MSRAAKATLRGVGRCVVWFGGWIAVAIEAVFDWANDR